MPFARPSLSDLVDRAIADVETRFPGADSRLRRSALGVLARVHAGALHGAYGWLDHIARQVVPSPATEAEYLDAWARVWDTARRPAAPAEGLAEIAGAVGATVPADTLLQRADGREYRTLADATVAPGPDGTAAALSVRAVEPGLDGNADAGVSLALATPLPGIAARATVAEGGLSAGADEEADDQLLDRLLLRIREPPHGGAARDYRRWALEVPGVTRVWVYPGWLGAGTVGVTFVMDGKPDSIVPTEAEVQAVADHIAPLRPVTADVTVFAPVPVPLDLAILVTPDSPAVREAVTAELVDLLARDAAPGATLRRSRIGEAISAAAGEEHHVLLAPAEDVAHGPGEIPVLGAIAWSLP